MKKFSVVFLILTLTSFYMIIPSVFADTDSEENTVSEVYSDIYSEISEISVDDSTAENDSSDILSESSKEDEIPLYLMAGTITFKGVVIPDVTLVLDNESEDDTKTLTSKANKKGQFCFENVAEGDYKLSVYTKSGIPSENSDESTDIGESEISDSQDVDNSLPIATLPIKFKGSHNTSIDIPDYFSSFSESSRKSSEKPEQAEVFISSVVGESSAAEEISRDSAYSETSETSAAEGLLLSVYSDEKGYAIQTVKDYRMLNVKLDIDDSGDAIIDARAVRNISELNGYPGINTVKMRSAAPMIIACFTAVICAVATVFIRRRFFS